MPLEKQKLQIPFGQGLAQEVAPSLVQPGKLLVAEQALIEKSGSVQQRPGTAALARDVFGKEDPFTGEHLFADGRETVVTTPERVITHQEADAQWRNVDNGYEADIRRVIVGERNGVAPVGEHFADVAIAGDWIVYAWMDRTGNDMYVRFVDYETGARTAEYTWAYTSNSPMVRIVTAGAYVHVFWHDLANTRLCSARWSVTNIEAGLTQIAVGANASGGTAASGCRFDAVYEPSTQKVYLAYDYDDGIDVNVCLVKGDTSMVTLVHEHEAFLTPADVPDSSMTVCTDRSTNNVFVAFHTGDDNIHLFIRRQSDLASVVAMTEVSTHGAGTVTVTSVADSTKAWITWERTNATDDCRETRGIWVSAAGAVSSFRHWSYHTGILSRPWLRDGLIYIVGYVYEETTFDGVTVAQRNAYILEQCTEVDAPD